MSGIYIHIPFCSTKCHYCNFLSTVSLKYRKEVFEAIGKEIAMRKNYLGQKPIETIYFGGGTPSLLSKDELKTLLKRIFDHFEVVSGAEITLEANPDDVNRKISEDWLDIGINRLSIGTQAFNDDILRKLNRRHRADQSLQAVQFAFESGFRNMSIDLIYGIPGLTNSMWEAEIEVAANLPVSHISAYHLTVEAGTALENLIRRKKYPNLSEEAGVEQFEILMDKLESVGYEHYEISNFAQNGLYSKHNRSYWQNKPYLGIGPSAHSYDLEKREWNTSNLRTYFEAIDSGERDFESEVLSKTDFYNEFIMLGLRTSEGVDLKELEKRFADFKADFETKAEKYFQRGQMVFCEGSYRLSRSGKFFADAIAADFFQ